MSSFTDWEIPGSRGLPIRGSTHLPSGDPRAVLVVIHGFKGYKEYGMFPWLAAKFAAAGHVVHRVNLSHSGMDHGHGDFDDRVFVQDTWSRGVEDVVALLTGIDRGRLAGQGRGAVLLGHSRGGAVSLLAAGRHGRDEAFAPVTGILSLSSPASLNRMSDSEQAALLEAGQAETPSSRTGQTLHVGAGWLQEQLDDPIGHDLLRQVGEITCPIGVIHGSEDPTVAPSDAVTLAQANPGKVRVHVVPGGDHVFNTPNPFPPDGDPSPQLAEVLSVSSEWLDQWVQ